MVLVRQDDLVTERFRASEVRLERESLLVALEALVGELPEGTRLQPKDLRKAYETAILTAKWARNRQESRDSTRVPRQRG
jgi:hypothetical protein